MGKEMSPFVACPPSPLAGLWALEDTSRSPGPTGCSAGDSCFPPPGGADQVPPASGSISTVKDQGKQKEMVDRAGVWV